MSVIGGNIGGIASCYARNALRSLSFFAVLRRSAEPVLRSSRRRMLPDAATIEGGRAFVARIARKGVGGAKNGARRANPGTPHALLVSNHRPGLEISSLATTPEISSQPRGEPAHSRMARSLVPHVIQPSAPVWVVSFQRLQPRPKFFRTSEE